MCKVVARGGKPDGSKVRGSRFNCSVLSSKSSKRLSICEDQCGEVKRIKREKSINTRGQPLFIKFLGRKFLGSKFSASFSYTIANNTLRPQRQPPGLRHQASYFILLEMLLLRVTITNALLPCCFIHLPCPSMEDARKFQWPWSCLVTFATYLYWPQSRQE